MRPTTTLRTAALLVAAGLVLAACGDDTEVGTTGDPAVTTAPPPTSVPGTVAPEDLAAVQAALDEARARWEAADIAD
jgi:multidrug efflux pump subunit AcrA (membrane-fusion protein)